MQIGVRAYEGQEDQLGALGLVVNTIALWNTRYRDEDIERLSPLVHEHINLHGRYYFGLTEALQRGEVAMERKPCVFASFRWQLELLNCISRVSEGSELRRRGPLFVTTGLPNVVPAELDRSPDGRGRLSYQRAWSLFREASEAQWTLHQLRHSALTHLGEDGVSAPLLMAKSRHRDLRTLSRYVRPGTKAVAQLTAEHDPTRRGKHPRR